jgi:hypothetical protein
MCTIRNLAAVTIACLASSAAVASEPAPNRAADPPAPRAAPALNVRNLGVSGFAVRAGPTRKAKVAYLGVVTSPVSSTLGRQLHLPEGTGLVVDFVAEATAARKAGITQHDILTRLDDQILVNVPQLVVLVRLKDPGAKVALTLIREGKQRQVTAELGETERPADAETQAFPMQNVALAPLDGTYPSRSPGGPASWVLGQLALESPSGNARWVDGEHDLAVTFANRLDSSLQVVRLAEQMARLKGALARHRQTLPETHPTIRQLRDQIDTLRVEMAARCRQPARSPHLVAKDLLGNILFEGPIDTDGQLKAVPEAIRAKVKSMMPLVIFSSPAIREKPKR